MRRSVAFITIGFSIAMHAHAQQMSPWQGEWGTEAVPASRLTLSNCTGQSCTFLLSHGGCSTLNNTPLKIVTSTEATATLPGEDAAHACLLHFQRDGSTAKPSIEVRQSGNGCGYYCISSATGFDTKVVQRSPTVYAGAHSDECMKDAGPARMATCLDASLADLEQQWESLYSEFPMASVPKGSSEYQLATQLDADIVAGCNAAADPTQCLRARFTSDLAIMNAKKQASINGSTERGDPSEGGRLARAIAGRYRHTFENGDVQGDHYRTTDRLTITPVGNASISFNVDLNFYNGHTCSLSGGALYRKDGSFVFDDAPGNAVSPAPACRLAIIPGSRGVTFKDLNGSCKDYCGERGGWNNEGFSFRERVLPKAASKPPAK